MTFLAAPADEALRADGVLRADARDRGNETYAGAVHRLRLPRVGRAPQGEASARHAGDADYFVT